MKNSRASRRRTTSSNPQPNGSKILEISKDSENSNPNLTSPSMKVSNSPAIKFASKTQKSASKNPNPIVSPPQYEDNLSILLLIFELHISPNCLIYISNITKTSATSILFLSIGSIHFVFFTKDDQIAEMDEDQDVSGEDQLDAFLRLPVGSKPRFDDVLFMMF
ncbi:hypothetical protein CsSME_00047879 [Camellia sinensis var. sinensis]